MVKLNIKFLLKKLQLGFSEHGHSVWNAAFFFSPENDKQDA